MHRAFQRRDAALVWIVESLIGPYIPEVLDSNMSLEGIDVGIQLIMLLRSSFFITSAK
jgi:hypothetical protein